MRGMLVRLAVGVLALAAAGCSPGGGSYTGASAYTPSPSGSGFLAVGSCAARDGAVYRQVTCDDGMALARVTLRHARGDAETPDCPATTDFVLTVDGTTGAGTASARSSATAATTPPAAPTPAATPAVTPAVPAPGERDGYACMRDLRGPHPGDPGGGGGPYTVVGDCVYRERPGEAAETPCAGRDARVPRFTVTAIVADRVRCPPATRLYVGLPHGRVGCAGRP